ncbi:MAG: thymidine phosphorylase [Actinomycetota bacterium]|nr:thymidine phosphorylase [Actinomycetota bacterium]
MARFDVVDLIRTKRDGGTLTDDQIRWFIDAYTKETVAHEQASALLMAIVWRGMEPNELSTWTVAMLSSGERMDLSSIKAPTVDKHSTGGVGDKVSLILAPMVAACGAADPMLSGRGLGHTGGTLDKLEAIPGYDVDLSGDEMLRVLADVGCVICSAGPDLAPADRKLYALRDVTGTVESIPLIASSIMSKKIAEGTEALVLDVKVGSAAFLPDISMARELAETMVKLGEAHDVKTSALLTNMDIPLGRTAGNGLEVTESVESLQGKGPDDLMAVTIALAQEMLDLVGLKADPASTIEDGSALEKWRAMVTAQGGDPDAKMPEAPERRTFDAPDGGFVAGLDARAVGIAAWRLGAGRARKEDPVSPSAGIVCLKKPGDEVEAGEPILELHADDPDRFENAVAALDGAVQVGPEQPEPPKMILERIGP